MGLHSVIGQCYWYIDCEVLFADTDLRVRLLGARTENEFKRLLWEQMKELADEQQYSNSPGRKLSFDDSTEVSE